MKHTKLPDGYLGRLVQFDERSRNFRVTAVAPRTPRSYAWACPLTLDQKSEGSCVGHGVAHGLIARPSSVPGINHAFATEKIYWEAQRNDPWDGGAYPGAVPYYEGTSVLAGIKAAQALGYFTSYRWAFGLQDLIVGVGYAGPAVIGVPWLGGMVTPDNQGWIHATGSPIGGHCVLVRAVNVANQSLTIRNSWGPGWGQNGDAKISFSDMDLLLKQQGEAVFFEGRKKI